MITGPATNDRHRLVTRHMLVIEGVSQDKLMLTGHATFDRHRLVTRHMLVIEGISQDEGVVPMTGGLSATRQTTLHLNARVQTPGLIMHQSVGVCCKHYAAAVPCLLRLAP